MAGSLRVIRKQYIKLPSKITGPNQVKVGFPKGKADSDLINIAIWNHYGTRGGGWGGPIPARPFLSNSMRDNRNKYRKAMLTSARKLMRSQTSLKTVMRKLGIVAQGDIQAEITNLSSPANSAVTIALKGSSNPLINTGGMKQAVTYEVGND